MDGAIAAKAAGNGARTQTEPRRIVVGATGASGAPLLVRCLQAIAAAEGYEAHLVATRDFRMTLGHETGLSYDEVRAMAACAWEPDNLGAPPASGTFRTEGMVVVPCSMKTAAGICSGYSENLLLRAADVCVKEHRPLVLAARESPLSPIHLRNLHELSLMPGVRVVPPMLTYYHHPESIEDMADHVVAKLLEPFGIEKKGFRRWTGM